MSIVQRFSCNNCQLAKCFKISKCVDCQGGGRGGCCQFLGTVTRLLHNNTLLMSYRRPLWLGSGSRTFDQHTQSMSFYSKPDEAPRYPQVFNRPLTTSDIEQKAVQYSWIIFCTIWWLCNMLEGLRRNSTSGAARWTTALHAAKSHPLWKGDEHLCAMW